MFIENLQEIESALDPYSVMGSLLPGVKKRCSGHQLRSRCPVHGGDGDENFSLNLENHTWFCHSRGCKGRGLIDLYSKTTGVSFIEAAKELARQFNLLILYRDEYIKKRSFQTNFIQKPTFSSNSTFTPKHSMLPSDTWQKQALDFAQNSHYAALKNPLALQLLKERGFNLETIRTCCLGWNEFNRKDAINLWGLSSVNAKNTDIRLPRGIVIPTFFDGKLMKLKIRRVDLQTRDKHKYIIVSGSRSTPSFFGTGSQKPIFIVESEFDAMLIQQEAGDLCCCMSIPAGHKPDTYADQILRDAPTLVFSLDCDVAGVKSYSFWKSIYPKMKIWLSDKEKSPGDDFKYGISLREWVKAGLSQ